MLWDDIYTGRKVHGAEARIAFIDAYQECVDRAAVFSAFAHMLMDEVNEELFTTYVEGRGFAEDIHGNFESGWWLLMDGELRDWLGEPFLDEPFGTWWSREVGTPMVGPGAGPRSLAEYVLQETRNCLILRTEGSMESIAREAARYVDPGSIVILVGSSYEHFVVIEWEEFGLINVIGAEKKLSYIDSFIQLAECMAAAL